LVLEAATKIAMLSKKIAETPEREVSGELAGVGDMGTENMRGQMYSLQLREKQVAASHTDAHPTLQEVRRQVAQAKELLSQEQPTRSHVTTTPSRARQQLEALLLVEQPLLAAYESESAALDLQLADARRQLKVFNRNEMRIAAAQREIELMATSYRRASANLEQARIDESQANERISNINVAQPASYEAKPTRPRLGINLACGMIAGCSGALLLSLGAERRERAKRARRG
jgi:polysaccharide biosynthesis protein PslE